MYRYIIKSTGGNSLKYGNCEICGKPATEIYSQIEERKYNNGWTRLNCSHVFGHEECLIKIRTEV